MQEFPRWARMACELCESNQPFSIGMDEMALAVSTLIRDRDDIHGAVIVAGFGEVFPERALLCTSTSRFEKVRPEIHQLILCDPAPLAAPELMIDVPVQHRFLEIGDSAPAEPLWEGTSSYGASLQTLLPRYAPDSVDALVFLSIPDLEEQIQKGLGELVERVLKPRGVFLGSGSFDQESVNLHSGLTVERTRRFPNPDHAGLYQEHLGFLARKKVQTEKP